MTDVDNDPFAVAFGRFRTEVDNEVRPIGVGATRVEVGRRRRRRTVAIGIAVVVAIAVPVAAFAVHGSTGHTLPAGSPSTSVSPTLPPKPSVPPSAVNTSTIHPSSVRTAAASVSGTLTYTARTGDNGGQQNATVITVSGTRIAEQHIGDPTWGDSPPALVETALAPDGQHIAFLGNGQGGGLDVTNIDGSDLRDLDDQSDAACGSPMWSPDSSRIVYARGLDAGSTQVTVVNADGTGRHAFGTGCYPVFSADGSQIAYVSKSGGLDVVNVDGTGRRVVAGKLGPAGIQTIISVDHDHAIVDVGFAPCCDSGDTRHWHLINPYVVDLATGKTSRLPSAYGTIWSALYTADGGMVLRVAPHGAGKPGRLIFLAPDGTKTGTFDESQLSAPGYPVTAENIDLVGYQP